MTDHERKQTWEAFKTLYRHHVQALADIAALKMMLKSIEISGSLIPGWEKRLEDVRQTAVYKNYLERAEGDIVQAEQLLAEARQNELIEKMPLPRFLN